MTLMLQRLKAGYATLLDGPIATLDQSGFTLIETERRNLPEWAAWLLPVWLFALDEAVLCSVAPQYAAQAATIFADVSANDLLDRMLLTKAQTIISDQEWVQCELFYYPHPHPPQPQTTHRVERLQPDTPGADHFVENFDGGTFVIRDEQDEITASAAIKDKGILQELAVGTQPQFRRQGMGKAVVTAAITEILARGKVVTYWPDSLDNVGSYALAQSVGLVKVATMLFCSYEQPGWTGFSGRSRF